MTGICPISEFGIPLLDTYGFRATFFVPASWVEVRDTTMSWSQLRELISMGHRVQSHSSSHPALTHCSDVQLRQELEGSRLLLEDKLGTRVVLDFGAIWKMGPPRFARLPPGWLHTSFYFRSMVISCQPRRSGCDGQVHNTRHNEYFSRSHCRDGARMGSHAVTGSFCP